jgi:hypothetical protein
LNNLTTPLEASNTTMELHTTIIVLGDDIFHLGINEPKSNKFLKEIKRRIKFIRWKCRSRSPPHTLEGHEVLMVRKGNLGKMELNRAHVLIGRVVLLGKKNAFYCPLQYIVVAAVLRISTTCQANVRPNICHLYRETHAKCRKHRAF